MSDKWEQGVQTRMARHMKVRNAISVEYGRAPIKHVADEEVPDLVRWSYVDDGVHRMYFAMVTCDSPEATDE